MNKLFQTALMAALLVTSGSASESPTTIVGKATFEEGMSVDSGTTLSLADGAEATLAKGKTIEVMGTLEGPTTGTAAIKCEDGKATIDINTSQLETMESSDVTTLVNKGLGYSSEDMTYYHMKPLDEAGKIENRANIIFTNVDVTENSLLGEVQSINDSNKTLVLADNSGSEPAQMTLKNPNSDAVEIKVNLANEGYDTPYTVTFTGPFYIYGDNTHFTQGIVNFDNSETTFSEDNSAFQSEMNITNQSVVTYNKPVTLSKDVVVSNSKVVFKELVNLTNGAKLVIGGTLTPVLTYVINFPVYNGHYFSYKFAEDLYYAVGFEDGGLWIHKGSEEDKATSAPWGLSGGSSWFFGEGFLNNVVLGGGQSAGLTIDYTNLSTMKDSTDTLPGGNSYPFTYKEIYDLFSAIESGAAKCVFPSQGA